MSPKRRGGMRGRGRGMSRKRGISRQSLSRVTVEDTDAEGTSTDGNVSSKRDISRSPSLSRKKQMEYIEERELSLPRLKPTIIPENSTLQSMLNRDKYCGYIMTDEELDNIQWELESMLTALTLRKSTIKEELNTFASMQFARSQHRTTKNPKLPTIRPRAAAEISPVNECHKMKVEFDPTSKELPPSKTESANKFWSMVEPYLSHATKEDIDWLEDMVESYKPNKKMYEIPPLGEHYSKVWAREELEMQKAQSSSSPQPSKKLKLAERISPDVVELINRANSAIQEGSTDSSYYQKIVSILSSSNTSTEDFEEQFSEFDEEDKPQEMSNACKEFYAEQNVKKQLYKLGLIGRNAKALPPPLEQSSPLPNPDEDHDEILEEIRKCDENLAQLREMNRNQLTSLLEACKIDYNQQIVRSKMDVVNKKILNFKRQQNESWSNEKKVAQMAKEDEELNLLIEERCRLALQIRSIAIDSKKYVSPSASDDSESSNDESGSFKEHIKTEPSEQAVVIKEEVKTYEYETEENYEDTVEANNEPSDVVGKLNDEELNDNNVEYENQIVNGESKAEETENTVNESQEPEEMDVDKNDQNNQTELKTNTKPNIKIRPQGKVREDEINDLTKSTIKRRGKPKLNTLENEPESKRLIKIKQEPVDDDELDLDSSEDTIDGVKRELRPRKLNETTYFEPFDRTSSEGSDFSDHLD